MLKFNDVTKLYHTGDTAVRNINIHIKPKEFVSIIGHSGAGKTTLLKLILAEESPTEGTVTFEDIDIHQTFDKISS